MSSSMSEDFPYEEIRDDIVGGNGDLFSSVTEALTAGFDIAQVWSVTEEEDVITHGPPHHWINLLGYVCTEEHHDQNTYYQYDYSEQGEDQ
jgi:hypothetical protein